LEQFSRAALEYVSEEIIINFINKFSNLEMVIGLEVVYDISYLRKEHITTSFTSGSNLGSNGELLFFRILLLGEVLLLRMNSVTV